MLLLASEHLKIVVSRSYLLSMELAQLAGDFEFLVQLLEALTALHVPDLSEFRKLVYDYELVFVLLCEQDVALLLDVFKR